MNLEVNRVFSHQEHLPDLNFEKISSHLSHLLRECVQSRTKDGQAIRWPEGSGVIETHPTEMDMAICEKTGQPLFWTDVAQLINTPRALRRLAERALRRWSRLAGEVSLFELIIVESVRSAFPATGEQIIALMYKRSKEKSSLSSSIEKRQEDFRKMTEKFKDALAKLCADCSVDHIIRVASGLRLGAYSAMQWKDEVNQTVLNRSQSIGSVSQLLTTP